MYIKKSRLICGAIAIVIVTAIVVFCALNPFGIENSLGFLKFSYMTRIIDSMYYEDMDRSDAAEMAIAGVAASTGDPYTMYLWGDDAKQYMEEISGNYCGVGLYIEWDMEEDLISVVSAISGGPAEQAGITTGDKILKIDGQNYAGSQLSEASSYMKGEEGTEVTLTIRSLVDNKERDITLVRSEITIESVMSRMIGSDIGYISISQFIEGVSDIFAREYIDLTESGARSLIIDLRNNPGGLLDEAVKTAGLFVPGGEIVTFTLDKNENCNEFYSEGVNNKKPELPIVILMNGGSASASEVLAGALRDYEIATIVGEKSYGKGIVQSAMNIGDSILSVTVARYYTPDGVCIHGEGMEPDVMTEMSPEKSARISSLEIQDDEQLRAAIECLNKN